MQVCVSAESMTPHNPLPEKQSHAKPLKPGKPGDPAPEPKPAQPATRRRDPIVWIRLGILAGAVVITFLTLGYMNWFGALFGKFLAGYLTPEYAVKNGAPAHTPPPVPAARQPGPRAVLPAPPASIFPEVTATPLPAAPTPTIRFTPRTPGPGVGFGGGG